MLLSLLIKSRAHLIRSLLLNIVQLYALFVNNLKFFFRIAKKDTKQHHHRNLGDQN